VAIFQSVVSSLRATIASIVGVAALTVAAAVLVFGTTLVGAVAVYFVVWWIFLFAVLPIGARSQAEEGSVERGSEPGAPSRPLLRQKALWTTLGASIVMVLMLTLLPLAGI
jgi:predicted secreted protein